MTLNPELAAIARDARWLAHRYDPGHDAVHFRRVEREQHRAATFISDEYLGVEASPVVLRRTDAVAASEAGPLHFIFHSAFCCSTLLARAFDIEGVSMGLKEPVILQDLAGWRHRGAAPAELGTVADSALRLLARPFAPGESVIVKPSNIVNGLAPGLLAARPAARAVLLYAPLKVYLGSIARKGIDGRRWVRDLLLKQLKEGLVDLGLEGDDYFMLTDLQAAAIGWLTQKSLFARLADRFGDRVRTLDSEVLTARPHEAIAALSALYDLQLTDAQVGSVVTGPAFNSHSKSGAAFGGHGRAIEQLEGAAIHADEIDKVAAWAEAVAANAGVSLTPGPALI